MRCPSLDSSTFLSCMLRPPDSFFWLCCQPHNFSHRFIRYLLYFFSFLRLIWVWLTVPPIGDLAFSSGYGAEASVVVLIPKSFGIYLTRKWDSELFLMLRSLGISENYTEFAQWVVDTVGRCIGHLYEYSAEVNVNSNAPSAHALNQSNRGRVLPGLRKSNGSPSRRV
jgi:hypothetical protein